MERIHRRTQSLKAEMVATTDPLMRQKVCAYSHQGHGPRADHKGRIHISDFRHPAESHLHPAAGSYIRPEVRLQQPLELIAACRKNLAPRNPNITSVIGAEAVLWINFTLSSPNPCDHIEGRTDYKRPHPPPEVPCGCGDMR